MDIKTWVGLGLGIVVGIPCLIIIIALFVGNTRALNTQKALRTRLQELNEEQKRLEELGSDAPAEQYKLGSYEADVARHQENIICFRNAFDEWSKIKKGS
jgi:uncharacterized membrane-anchored protein YhcB (DUF1043 family)